MLKRRGRHGWQARAVLRNGPMRAQFDATGRTGAVAGRSGSDAWIIGGSSGQQCCHAWKWAGTATPSQFSASLSTRQKYAFAYRRIVSVDTVARAAFDSGFEIAAGTGPDFPTNGWGPFAERFGYNALNISTTIFFSKAVVPVLVHQDPRYPVLGQGKVKTRVAWALKREFAGFGDNGRDMPNYGNLVGFGLASLTANAYSPRSGVSYGNTLKSYSIKIGSSCGFNVAREFRVHDWVRSKARRSGGSKG